MLQNAIAESMAKFAIKDDAHKWINVQKQPFSSSADDFVRVVEFKADSKLSTISVAPTTGKVTRTTYFSYLQDLEKMSALLQIAKWSKCGAGCTVVLKNG